MKRALTIITFIRSICSDFLMNWTCRACNGKNYEKDKICRWCWTTLICLLSHQKNPFVFKGVFILIETLKRLERTTNVC